MMALSHKHVSSPGDAVAYVLESCQYGNHFRWPGHPFLFVPLLLRLTSLPESRKPSPDRFKGFEGENAGDGEAVPGCQILCCESEILR